jgi:hypothetical protein
MPSSLRFSPKNGVGGNDDGYCTGAALEVTVLSAESLRLPPSYSPLPRRLRPYVTVSSDASDRCYSTAVASSSGTRGEHSWGGDTVVVVPVGAEFLAGRADVHVSVLSEPSCRLVGATLLGRCAIPAADVLDGLREPRARRRLSYSLRAWGQQEAAVVHLAVRVLGLADARAVPVVDAQHATAAAQQQGWCRVAMGIPVSGAAAAAAVVGTPWPTWGAASR